MEELIKLLRDILVPDTNGTPEAQLFILVAKLCVPGLLALAAALVGRGALLAAGLVTVTALGTVGGLVVHHYSTKPQNPSPERPVPKPREPPAAAKGPPPSGTAQAAVPRFDVRRDHTLTTRPLRQGSSVASQGDCEHACDAEAQCQAYVYDAGICSLRIEAGKPIPFPGSIVGMKVR